MRCSNLGPEWSSATQTLGFGIQFYDTNKNQKLKEPESDDDFEPSSCTLMVSGLSLGSAGCAGLGWKWKQELSSFRGALSDGHFVFRDDFSIYKKRKSVFNTFNLAMLVLNSFGGNSSCSEQLTVLSLFFGYLRKAT